MSCGWVATRIWLWLPLKPTSPSRISRQIARQRWIVRNANIVKGEVPVALVVKAKGADVSEEELKQFCLANGPAYARPRRIDFVTELPLNGPGKIHRKVVQRVMRDRYGAIG